MKYVHVYWLIEPGLSALNGAGTKRDEAGNENINVLKKYVYKGSAYPYISGQAFRRWMRETLDKLDGREGAYTTLLDDISMKIFVKGKHYDKSKNGIILKKKMFEDFPSADLFGYMLTISNNKSIIRRSPTLNSALLGVLNSKVIDLVTKHRDIHSTTKQEKTSFSKKELTYNVFYGTMSIEFDRIGLIMPEELTNDVDSINKLETIDFGKNDRKEKVRKLLTALFELQGGANLTRYFGSPSPRYAVIVVTDNGNNIFANMRPKVNGGSVIVPESFIEFTKDYYGKDNVFIYSYDVGQDSLIEEDVKGTLDYKKIIDDVVKKL